MICGDPNVIPFLFGMVVGYMGGYIFCKVLNKRNDL